jgi:23S rRNA (cytosine1962-C5)-methyltransferase
LLDIKGIISEVLNIDIENISIKLRSTQKGKNQYNKLDYSGALLSVQEFGLLFLINPFDYLDTGLFLDHRITRQWVKKEALNKRVLNLFAYTGSFSVYAAAGDAVKVTTVDMSNTYLQWAEKNMHLNGFKSSKKYDYIREDILDWIPTVPASSYDLIILDPPTFSNSKKMLLTWDVQRDHVHLINQIRSILSPGGILYFSNNYKKFKLNLELIEGYESIEELTDKSIPEDFERSKPHVSFRLVNKMV